ncbi:hypothetical protein SAMN05216266_12166 [Amycolatopsis marina]|uniref:Probable membrane transporter protein n=1 Tax=Amycolatopsis marina TaxID=490629 RepID=A0A1I1C5J8_9PSEU|nr:sulfite exporter TauE/SafE family protein [Amycolatopsis marina]SFB57831.1 hypothetical protein SAMN05216266_12166 [Amycolatopsis marina]
MVSVTLVLAGIVVLVGALVQGAAGFGMNLIAAPLLTLADPQLVPVPLLLIAAAHAVLSMAREWHDIDWRGVGWAMLGRLPGTALGVLAVATLAPRPFAAIVGASVLLCGLLSVTSWRPTPTPGPLLLAGVASGTFGTAASIGGPPLALLYQHSSGRQIRATLAACFAVGTVISLAGLGLGGQIETAHLVFGSVLLPFLVAGFALSGPARRILDAGRTRATVVTIAMASALVLLVRSLFG